MIDKKPSNVLSESKDEFVSRPGRHNNLKIYSASDLDAGALGQN